MYTPCHLGRWTIWWTLTISLCTQHYMLLVCLNVCRNVPAIICSEIFPLRARGELYTHAHMHTHTHTHTHMHTGISTALSYTGMWIGAVVVSQISPILIVSSLGVHGTYYLMAGVCLVLFFFVLFLIPETKVKIGSFLVFLCRCLFKPHTHVQTLTLNHTL